MSVRTDFLTLQSFPFPSSMSIKPEVRGGKRFQTGTLLPLYNSKRAQNLFPVVYPTQKSCLIPCNKEKIKLPRASPLNLKIHS